MCFIGWYYALIMAYKIPFIFWFVTDVKSHFLPWQMLYWCRLMFCLLWYWTDVMSTGWCYCLLSNHRRFRADVITLVLNLRLMLLPCDRWNSHWVNFCYYVWQMLLPCGRCYGHWVDYFNFSSGLFNRTSSHMCGRWYLPIFLFRDGLFTLI